MGYYYELKTKVIKLRRDTPKEIIEFIDNWINGDYSKEAPKHKLFELERWRTIFYPSGWFDKEGDKTFFIKDEDVWKLFIHADIKSGYFEIEAFVDWITPYVNGHKPKEYIGFMEGEDEHSPTNLYITRGQSKHNNIREVSGEQYNENMRIRSDQFLKPFDTALPKTITITSTPVDDADSDMSKFWKESINPKNKTNE